MRCPQCGKEVKDPTLPCRPFCSDRCKLIDLGKWISEEYRVASADSDKNEPEDPKTIKDPVEEE